MIWRQFIFSAIGESMNTLINLRVETGLPAPQINRRRQPIPTWEYEFNCRNRKGERSLVRVWVNGRRQERRKRKTWDRRDPEWRLPSTLSHAVEQNSPPSPTNWKKFAFCLMWFDFFFLRNEFFLWQITKTASMCMKRNGRVKIQVTPWMDFVGYLPNICFPPSVFLTGPCLPHVTKQQDPEEANPICTQLRRRYWFV